jgi:hypothetical protein
MADAGPDDLPPAPAGVSGPSNTIAATVAAAQAAGMANVMYLEASTHAPGDDIGDLMPLPPPPDVDSTILGGQPGPLPGGDS